MIMFCEVSKNNVTVQNKWEGIQVSENKLKPFLQEAKQFRRQLN